MASGVAHRLHGAHFRICMTELSQPLAVRREVCFCEAVYDGRRKWRESGRKKVSGPGGIAPAWKEGVIPLLVDPDGQETRRS